eukprot:tig00000803_g4320.t1
MAVVELLDFTAAAHTWHFKKWDFLTLIACFLAVRPLASRPAPAPPASASYAPPRLLRLDIIEDPPSAPLPPSALVIKLIAPPQVFFGGVELGVGIGILFSLLLVVIRMAFLPDIPRLGRLVGTESYEDKGAFHWATEQPGLVVLQVRVPLYFFNREMLVQRVRAAEAEAASAVKVVVLDFGPCPDIDSDAATALKELHAELTLRGRLLLIVGLTERVKRYFDRAQLREAIGLQNFLPDVPTAVKHATYGSKDGTRIIGAPPAGAIGSTYVIQFMEERSRPSPSETPAPVAAPEIFVEGGGI